MITATVKRVRSAPLTAQVGIALMLMIVLCGIFVPIVSPYSITGAAGVPLSPPSATHLFGTDNLGRDVFTRTFAAARLDIGLAVVGVTIPLLVGTLLGALAGVSRSRVLRDGLNLLINAVNAFPFLVLALAVITILGTGVVSVIIAISVTTWARYATLAQAKASTVREADFISAFTVLGYSRPRIVGRHVLPNVFRESFSYAISDFTFVILTVGSLSFLGAGINPPTPEWGSMIAEGRLYLLSAPWIVLAPGSVLTITGLAMSLIGERGKDSQ